MNTPQLDTIRRYLVCLNASDTQGLVATFEDDGFVISPFLGTMPAGPFFAKLREASSNSVITPIDLFTSVEASTKVQRVAAYFRYDWTLKDGKVVTFTCVDVFEFRPGSNRIASMTIIYDTHPLREEVGDKYA